MTLLKAGRTPMLAGLLCVLLLGFAATSYGVVRWDVVGSPTEVINTGRSEVTGGVKLIAHESGTTGTSLGGAVQIGLIYDNPAMQIDNLPASGIILAKSPDLASASIVLVENFDLNGQCTGRITINIPAGVNVVPGSFLSIEGVRGRIDASLAVTPGTDLFVDLQSINDPAANNFTPDRVRVAKSLDGMNITIKPSSLLLCFATTGVAPGSSPSGGTITITEGFARAFVDNAPTNAASLRVDSLKDSLGAPTNPTQFLVWLEGIPTSVSGIIWTNSSVDINTGAQLVLVDKPTFDKTTGVAQANYEYHTPDQANLSDIRVESFTITPTFVLKSGATLTGTVLAGVTLAPTAEDLSSTCSKNPPVADDTDNPRPRFLQMFESDAVATNNPPDDPLAPLATIARCNCYLLFTYATFDAGFNTGIAIANTTGDKEVFGDASAPDQLGKITFYFYDKAAGFVGSTQTAADIAAGTSFVGLLSGVLPTGVTAFSGYIIAKADFQFCHGFAYIADDAFAAVAHGYIANVIPDPAMKGPKGVRFASDAGDIGPNQIPAGEGLNN